MKIQVFNENSLVTELTLIPGKIYTVGRKETCQIVLGKYPGISREHFEIDEDGSGAWRINLISDVLLIQFNGEDKKDFLLKDSGEFYLKPYKFKFAESKDSSKKSQAPEAQDLTDNSQLFSNIEIIKNQSVDPIIQSENLVTAHSDDNTAIHSFNGIPYIKIMGQKGKKSEYFRLEGNLWIIGGDENASVHIKDNEVSNNHFEISKTEKGFFLMDMNSANGTDLNGQKLTSKKPQRLLSGDIITIGNTSLQFELRDHAFKRKVNNIPLNMYKNPLVFFDQDVAIVNLREDDGSHGQAEQLSVDPMKKPMDRKTLLIRFAAAVILLIVITSQLLKTNEDDKAKQTIGADPFSQLSPAEQKIVVQTHNLAKQLFLAKNYELALTQLEKLHSIIPVYKDSKEIEEFCVNSRELKRQQAIIEKQRYEQQQIENEVNSYLAQCNQRYSSSDDIDGVKACLAPATELDPNNPEISQLITDVTARQEEKKIREKIIAEQEDKVRRGKEMFTRARELHSHNNYLQAIEAYENHIHSGLPDPQRLVKKSERFLATIETKIKNQKTQLIGQAQSSYDGTKYKEAIKLARQAQKVDPYDPHISAFLFKVEKELENQVKGLYMDSVLEEKFGNLEASRVKWEEIVKIDVEDGSYHRKAKRKLKQYGFKY
jgi:pSer/pThr/pTyr-binding forkhead associated (FHA) protein